ncbi:nucleoside triphosphate pyrophosphohydrolase [uncultured Sphingomonas sp.]|uniref:nucleoside triphosphate pyrophosphohydrolase n=1 Tax=uncultured Sphingomonas sp. TaxID=158754 RepID=UPI0025F82A92|nr:nucleoside triphosphate pyrophosphohydrolase [uncultured Sphingomonas sp.]
MAVERLLAIMARLRDPTRGCEWDVAQTWATIAPYTIEEAYEVADAIARNDADDLKDELGDLLLQVVFHARIAEEADAFAFADVVTAISDKMERRHPHIFGNASHSPGWEELKAAERRDTTQDDSALAGVAAGLPALMRAVKLQKRAARTGFDWPDQTGAIAKIVEEIEEVKTASEDQREDEIGDLLFAVVNWARHLGVDPEAALRSGNAKFERRFRAMEALGGEAFAALSLDDKEALWQQVKRG